MAENLPSPFVRVLSENSQKPEYALNFLVRDAEPTEDGTFATVRNLGSHHIPQILIFPYCTGSPGSSFSFKLWGWWAWGQLVELESSPVVWIPTLIAEFNCVAGTLNGLASRNLKPSEFLCSELTLVKGSLGNGRIYQSEGSPAAVLVDLPRPRKIQFDFRQGDAAPAFGNALWMQSTQP